MNFRRTPNATRIAAAWMRRARETPRVVDRVKAFLESQGDKKVKSPSTGNDIQISTLKSSDEPADQRLFQELLSKWSGGGDDDDGDGSEPDGKDRTIKTKAKLKAVVDDLVEDAMNFGLTEEEAREYTKGLQVGDDEEAITQVEKHLNKAIDKRVEENKAKEEAAKKRALRTDTPEALDGFRQEMFDAAKAVGVPNVLIQKILTPLVLDAGEDVVESVKANIQKAIDARSAKIERRKDVRDRAEATADAVRDARNRLERAKKRGDIAAVSRAESDLFEAEEQHRSAEMNVSDVESDEYAEYEDNARADAAQAEADAASAMDEIEDAQARIAELRESGDEGSAGEIATLEEAIRSAEQRFGEAGSKAKEIRRQLASKEKARNRRLMEESKAQMDASWERSKKNRGMLLFDATGKAHRYDPSPTDAVYEYMMTLLGERVEERALPDIDKTPSRDGFDDTESDDDWTGKGKGKGGPPTGPTKSGRPRNPDGSSPGGNSEDTYGPGEFWRTDSGKWSAKNRRGEIDTFDRQNRAREYAKTASRVASRYLRGES